MERALVLIGVQNAGGLPTLPAVADALLAMRDWAEHQGITGDLIIEISDVGGTPVTAADVTAKVAQVAQRPTLEQLIIFFCGHGIVVGYSEFWLLSGAQTNPNEAVNVAKTIECAVTGRIPYVVLVSDACRLPADALNSQFLNGAVILPAPTAIGPSQKVDVFYACLLGNPAHEVQDATTATKYHAIYTDVFTAGLEGDYPESIDPSTENGVQLGIVRAGKLADALPTRLADRLIELKVALTLNQEPDARICYNPTGWLSQVPIAGVPAPAPSPPSPPGRGDSDGGLGSWGRPPAEAIGGIGDIRRGRRRPGTSRERLARPAPSPAQQAADEAAERLAEPIEWAEVPRTGVLLRGADTREVAVGAGARSRTRRTTVEVTFDDGSRHVGVLIRFDNGSCAVVPVLADHTSVVTVEAGQVVDVWLARRAEADDEAAAACPVLHCQTAARARYGLSPTPNSTNTDSLDVDPALAIYLAYALADLGRRDEIASMDQSLRQTIGTSFFDVQLMLPGAVPTALPGVPLLSRGWALLDDTERFVGLPAPWDSSWTVFPESAFDQLRTILVMRSELYA